MTQTVEVFENEEAEKFLEYFSAYKKFSAKANYLRRMIALNTEKTLWATNPQLGKIDNLDPIGPNQSAISLVPTHGEAQLVPTRL